MILAFAVAAVTVTTFGFLNLLSWASGRHA